LSVPKNFVFVQGQGSVDADQINSFVQAVVNIAALRNFSGVGQMLVFVEGAITVGDGGQGFYYWNATTAAADNGISVVRPHGAGVGAWVFLPLAGRVTHAIVYVIEGGGSPISTGVHGQLYIPFPCVISAVTLLADQTGSISVDIWKTPLATYPPNSGNTICGTDFPTISSAQSSQDTTLTGWTTAINPGDTLMYNVQSVTNIQRVTIVLTVD
jgi:hypothetical protein